MPGQALETRMEIYPINPGDGSDRWAPGAHAIDVESIGRFANAFANLALQLSKG